jgi:hypothetical protein
MSTEHARLPVPLIVIAVLVGLVALLEVVFFVIAGSLEPDALPRASVRADP